MISFEEYELENGLRVLLQPDRTTPLVAVNVLYDVGSRHENPGRTGFAHLFEHLMFGGSRGAPSFDDPIQLAGGECNAFTNSDLTNFFSLIPSQNLELALFLEADRMENLVLNERRLAVQRSVVAEEFKETCLNQPYGDVWHILAPLAYTRHPYQWPTIGKQLDHIADADLSDVRSFYERFYGPNNAILVLSGHFNPVEVKTLIERHFSGIAPRGTSGRTYELEPEQNGLRHIVHHSDVPVDSVYMAFHMCGRTEPGYYATDMLSDIFASGESSRLHRLLVKRHKVCSEIDAYITGTNDPGLFVIEAKPSDGNSLGDIEGAIWQVIDEVKQEVLSEHELERHQNKIESTIRFSNCSIVNKAMNLAYFKLIDDPDLLNTEQNYYAQLTPDDIIDIANHVLTESNCCILEYRSTIEELHPAYSR